MTEVDLTKLTEEQIAQLDAFRSHILRFPDAFYFETQVSRFATSKNYDQRGFAKLCSEFFLPYLVASKNLSINPLAGDQWVSPGIDLRTASFHQLRVEQYLNKMQSNVETVDLTRLSEEQIRLLDGIREEYLDFAFPISFEEAAYIYSGGDNIENRKLLALADFFRPFCIAFPGNGSNKLSLGAYLQKNSFETFRENQLKTFARKQEEKNNMQNTKSIFISHSSMDKELVDLFVDQFLRLGLEVPSNEIFCTSLAGMGIPSGEDFRNAIKDKLTTAALVFLLITPNYHKSQMCLAEMGAAWVLGKRVIPIIVPPIAYESAGILVSPNQIIRLDNSSNLDQLKTDVESALGLEGRVHLATWGSTKEKILKKISTLLADEQNGKK
jgi:hypothetical protein